MSLEDLTGSKYIDALVATNPSGAQDAKSQGDDHIRGIKNVLKKTFPNVTGAITATQDELNTLDGISASTAELNILDGVTLTTEEVNGVYRPGGADVAVADGGTGASDAAGARTNLGLGALAVKSTVANADLDAGAVTADKLNGALYAVGAVGTYAFLSRTAASNPGDTGTGAGGLAYADASNNMGGTPAGTWRCMGYSIGNTPTLWLRIS